MISATIQGIHKENNRKHITVQNGNLITGEAQRECVNAILKDCKDVSADDEVYCELDNGKLFCALYHPEKDDIGRKRIALIVWDKDTSNELIQKTLEVMGLEYERFLGLKGKVVERETSLSTTTTKVYVGLGICAVAVFGGIAYALSKR